MTLKFWETPGENRVLWTHERIDGIVLWREYTGGKI